MYDEPYDVGDDALNVNSCSCNLVAVNDTSY